MASNTNFIGAGKDKSDSKIETVSLRFNTSTSEMVKREKSEPFLRGPIPIAWLTRAARLPGKAIHVALAIQWLQGMKPNTTFQLTRKSLENFDVSRDAASDALNRLEAVGLITLEKKPGQRPLITVLSVSADK